MISMIDLGEIYSNGEGETAEVKGEIIKIVVFAEKELPNCKLTLQTVDGETLCEDYLVNTITRFYPKNAINTAQNHAYLDNHYSFGPLFIKVEGLGDGEKISNIAIIYKL